MSGETSEPRLYQLADAVDSKQTMLEFIRALKEDRENEVKNEKQSPSSPWGPGANGWENGSIETFLDAMASWGESTSAMTGEPSVADEPSWRDFAHMLHAGKFYE